MSRNKIYEWEELNNLAKGIPNLTTLFNQNNKRAKNYSINSCGLYLDYSKQRVDDKVMETLLSLARTSKLPEAIDNLLTGKIVNNTENRPALHSALRLPIEETLKIGDIDIVEQVHDSLNKLSFLVEKLNSKNWKGSTGETITDVVNIGVGGSDLGPVMVCDALKEWKSTPLNVHFISNMDGTQLHSLLKDLNPEKTLFIVCSKSFTTSDTFVNATTALSWLSKSLNISIPVIKKNQVIAISASEQKMTEWGVPKQHQLDLWSWVGGRFSLWSTIGFAIALSLGMANFRELLAGAHEMDEHFAGADLHENLPVILGLLGVWNSTFLNIPTHTVLPYDGRLGYFPKYLTQLEMESNGKYIDNHGNTINYSTCPILWGDVGTNGQHAFYQLLHQGTAVVSCDFIATINRYQDENFLNQHHTSLANCLAQSRVLAFGNNALNNNGKTEKHKIYRGNQPSTTLLLNELTPKNLGKLIALYEHKVYVMSVIWDINAFDQWGVEIGKIIATQLHDSIQNQNGNYDDSTNHLLKHIYEASNPTVNKTVTNPIESFKIAELAS